MRDQRKCHQNATHLSRSKKTRNILSFKGQPNKQGAKHVVFPIRATYCRVVRGLIESILLVRSMKRCSLSIAAILLLEQCSLTSGFSLVSTNYIKRSWLAMSTETEGQDDLQQMLVTLEKRVNEGPGSISVLEVEELEAITGRLVTEMKKIESERVSGLQTVDPIAATQDSPTLVAPELPTAPEVEILKSKEIKDLSNDEGPEWDGTGGMGQPRGTVNTYVIPGMEEMSPEEYQKALQKSIIDRQSERKKGGNYGNRATWDYLNNLSGETGVLKENPDD